MLNDVDTVNGIKMDDKKYLTHKDCSFYKFINSFGGYATCTKPNGCIYTPSLRVDNTVKAEENGEKKELKSSLCNLDLALMNGEKLVKKEENLEVRASE